MKLPVAPLVTRVARRVLGLFLLCALLPVPVVYLLVIIVGLPLVAGAAGWVLARGEPAGISRQAIT